MRQLNHIVKTSKSKLVLVAAAISTISLTGFGLPLMAYAQSPEADSMRDGSTYIATIRPLNNSHVSGTATFIQRGHNLTTIVNATGLEPGVHPQHIHGKDVAKAECPVIANDVNHDGYISVIEGAPSYGLIKVNLTSPQTEFGTPPTPALFEPFAGTADNKNFPVAAADGTLHFTQTYHFGNSSAAKAAYKSLMPLGNQVFVIHGATAPLGVDAAAFAALKAPRATGYNPANLSYDALLPVGCGPLDEEASTANSGNEKLPDERDQSVTDQTKSNPVLMSSTNQITANVAIAQLNLRQALDSNIQKLGANNNVATTAAAATFTVNSNRVVSDFDSAVTSAMNTYRSNLASGVNVDVARNTFLNSFAHAKDQAVNDLTVARNQLIDTLNQLNVTVIRDNFLNGFDMSVSQYTNKLEQVKNQL